MPGGYGSGSPGDPGARVNYKKPSKHHRIFFEIPFMTSCGFPYFVFLRQTPRRGLVHMTSLGLGYGSGMSRGSAKGWQLPTPTN